MKALELPDSSYVQAARSLLELGNHEGARQQLEQVVLPLRLHPDVLEVRWGIEAQAKNWPACLEISQTLIKVAPERPTGWIKRSYVLHRLNRTREALDGLFPIADRFPDIAIIPYNMARYAAQLQCSWEAERWLKQAMELGGDDYRLMALRDKELQPLWKSINGAGAGAKNFR